MVEAAAAAVPNIGEMIVDVQVGAVEAGGDVLGLSGSHPGVIGEVRVGVTGESVTVIVDVDAADALHPHRLCGATNDAVEDGKNHRVADVGDKDGSDLNLGIGEALLGGEGIGIDGGGCGSVLGHFCFPFYRVSRWCVSSC